MSCQLQSQVLMGKKFAFAPVKMTIEGLAHGADKTSAENFCFLPSGLLYAREQLPQTAFSF